MIVTHASVNNLCTTRSDYLICIIIDINECIEGFSTCSQICTNTNGSYTCNCMNGYTLNSDDHLCTGKF